MGGHGGVQAAAETPFEIPESFMQQQQTQQALLLEERRQQQQQVGVLLIIEFQYICFSRTVIFRSAPLKVGRGCAQEALPRPRSTSGSCCR